MAAPSSLARRCSCAHASSRTLICSPGWGVRWMCMAGWSTIRWGAPALPASGSPATPRIPAPRSSARPGKDRPRRSRSMLSWSMRTSSAPSPLTAPATRRPRQRFQLHRSEELLSGAAGGAGGRGCRRHGHRWARYSTPTPGPAGADPGPRAWGGYGLSGRRPARRAIVPVDAIAPGEAPPEWNELVRSKSSCVVRVAAGTGRSGRRGRARRRKPALEVCTFNPLWWG